MTDQKKISALPPATEVLADDVFPVVQDGSTKKQTMSALKGFVVEGIEGSLLSRSDISVNESFKYKKTVKAFPYRHPRYDEAYIRFGSVYPQTFYIDTLADEVLFISSSGQVTVFSWSTKTYLKTFSCPLSLVSENAVIKYSGEVRQLYLRGSGVLSVFDITFTYQWQVLTPITSYPINVQRNFAEHAGEWILSNDSVFPLGQYKSRGYFGIYKSDFTQIGSLYFSPLQCGINEGVLHEGSISKMQGMDFDGSVIYLGMGGYWDGVGATNKKYGAYGIRTFTRQGDLKGDYLLDPEKLVAKLRALGFQPDHCENEGVQYVKATRKVYSLLVGLQSSSDVSAAQVEGLYLLEEFSTSTSASDFSDCATTLSTFSESLRNSSTIYPRSASGIVNPLTGSVFINWAQILDYMKSVDMSAFRYYSSSVAPADLNGVVLPAGYLVTINNCNNSTFRVVAEGFNSTLRWQLSDAGQTENQPRPAIPMLPATTGVVTLGNSGLQWSDVRSVMGTFSGPLRIGQFTMATLPSASAFNGYLIIVTDASGGSKVCRSNGSVWQVLNTTTTVS